MASHRTQDSVAAPPAVEFTGIDPHSFTGKRSGGVRAQDSETMHVPRSQLVLGDRLTKCAVSYPAFSPKRNVSVNQYNSAELFAHISWRVPCPNASLLTRVTTSASCGTTGQFDKVVDVGKSLARDVKLRANTVASLAKVTVIRSGHRIRTHNSRRRRSVITLSVTGPAAKG